MANSVGLDERARYDPSHLDLHCLHSYLFKSTGLKGLCCSNSNSSFALYTSNSDV